jgi:uncharacterized membrane protein YdbT with pleckstrin-like domain
MSGGFCRFCGATTAPEARFCAGCGKAVPAAAPVPAAPETAVFELRPLCVRTVGELLLCVITAGVAWLVLWLARMGLRYRVTSERIETREGIVNRRSRFIDLYRIEDFEVDEPFFLRMRGAGNLIVRSMDKDQPVAALLAVPNVRDVYERVRTLAREERARKGVRVLDTG